MNGEKEWQQEFAAVPYEDAESSGQPTPAKSNGNAPTRAAGNMDEFSAMLDDSTPVRSSGTETSIGQYFLRNCGSIRDMLPESSPTKSRPVPLLGNSYRSSMCALTQLIFLCFNSNCDNMVFASFRL